MFGRKVVIKNHGGGLNVKKQNHLFFSFPFLPKTVFEHGYISTVVKKIEQTTTGLTGVQEKTNTNVDTFSTGVTTLTSEGNTCVQQQKRQVGVMGDFLVRLEDMCSVVVSKTSCKDRDYPILRGGHHTIFFF
jgi:hypothetical protein